MRISDWSSDVCSSDLRGRGGQGGRQGSGPGNHAPRDDRGAARDAAADYGIGARGDVEGGESERHIARTRPGRRAGKRGRGDGTTIWTHQVAPVLALLALNGCGSIVRLQTSIASGF